ncbi:MAG: class I SAM-dependent rRNA methyltransferase [Trueperaceae bacterium]|nr:class I SAM-dependent rRNA methyltransferase [Trueperaceae bacterium]
MSLITLNLGKKLESALASGHPWVYRNHLPEHRLKTGDWVRLEAGKLSRIGLFDKEGAIAVRLFAETSVPDQTFIHERVKDALSLRTFVSNDTNAYRLIYGESDFLPGLVADRYNRFVVIRTYSKSLESILDDVVWSLSKELNLKGIAWRTERGLEALWGELPPPELTVMEKGLKFIANLYEGQKTGLFLDQRENRQTLRGLAKDKTVLNLFSYNGGFSVYALAGGAKEVTSVDIAPAANADAERNAEINGFINHKALTADVFSFLQDYARDANKVDMVVLDPPSMAKDKQSKFAALRAYKKLNTLALKCLNQGGLLVSSSCTSQVFPEDFKTMLAEACQDAKVQAQVIHEAGHALDHPVSIAFPEGRYLKFVVLRVLK